MNSLSAERTNTIYVPSLRFLSRWSLLTALVVVALFVVFFGGIGMSASDSTLGQQYTELMQAVRSPVLYRIFTIFDALGWLIIGGSLVVMAAFASPHAPTQAALIVACGAGQLIGSLGGFMRLDGITDLAARYAASTPDQQAAVLQSYLDLQRIIGAHFHAGNLIQGVGFLLVAVATFSLVGFPRWLAVWFAVPGLLPLIQFGIVAAGSAFLFPILLLHLIIGIFGLHIALALTFWRPSSALVSRLSSSV